jgi:hypothetical protein
MKALNLIREEDQVEFERYDQLSYQDKNEVIELFVDDFYIGDMEVWKDSEMESREYVCINYEIIYLDTIKKL